jgi:putative DNA primase/helicase
MKKSARTTQLHPNSSSQEGPREAVPDHEGAENRLVFGRAEAELHLDTLFDGQHGDVIMSLGHDGFWAKTATGKVKYGHKFWDDAVHWRWPEDRELLLTDVAEIMAAGPVDVHLVPYLHEGSEGRPEGGAAERRWIHADWDGAAPIDGALIDELGALTNHSGSRPHVHVHVPLDTSVDAETHEALCRALKDKLGPSADPKVKDNDLLRLAGTLNWKTDPPEMVKRATWPGPPLSVDQVWQVLGRAAPGPGKARKAKTGPMPDNDDLPRRVKAALRVVTVSDLSGDTHRVVRACALSDLTLSVTRAVVNSREDLKARLAGRKDDDVKRCWLKVQADLTRQSAADVEFSDAKLGIQFAEEVLDGRFLSPVGDTGKLIGWKRWSGQRWVPASDADLLGAVREWVVSKHEAALEDLFAAMRNGSDEEMQQERRIRAGWAKAQTARKMAAIITTARPDVLIPASAFDPDPDLLNTPGGIVHLPTKALRPHDPAALMTKITSVAYVPGATHPDWTAALRSVPDDVRDWYQVRLGQGISGHMSPADEMLVQVGPNGSNGKSTVMFGVQAAIGDYFLLVGHRALIADLGAVPTEVADFQGARFALLEETPEERRLNVTRLKQLVGTPMITARALFKDNVTFAATHTLFLSTNYKPVVNETDGGSWRRLRCLVFPYHYLKPGQQASSEFDRPGDPTLRERVREGTDGQREASLAWLVEGAAAWYQAGKVLPPDPQRVEQDTREWRSEADLIAAYLDEARVEFDDGWHVLKSDVFSDFNDRLTAKGHKPWSDQTFAARFEQHEFVTGKITAKTGKPFAPWGELSRPREWLSEVPGTYRAWAGMRFARKP